MPDLIFKVPVTDEQADVFQRLAQYKKDLLKHAIIDDVIGYIKSCSRGRRSKLTSRNAVNVQLCALPDEVISSLPMVADKFDTTVSRVLRWSICDFLGLPPSHIDREYRQQEALMGRKADFYRQITVRMYDGDVIRERFMGRPTKQKFRAYLSQWCRKHLTPAPTQGD